LRYSSGDISTPQELAENAAKGHVVIGVGNERRIKIDGFGAGIGEFFRVPQPAEVIAEIKPVHLQ